MGFMQAQMTIKCDWIAVDGPMGIDFIDADICGKSLTWDSVKDYTENGKAYTIELITGYGVRLSAPGYMDCTSWEVYEDEDSAKARYQELKDEDNE